MELDQTANLIARLIPVLQAWWDPIKLLGMLIGFVMLIGGLVKAGVSKGRNPEDTIALPVTALAGILLINLLPTLDAMSMSLFAEESAKGLSYVPPNVDQPSGVFVQFAIYVVMLVGLFATIKGGRMLAKSSKNSDLFGPACTHIIGGSLAVNIVALVQTLGVTAGGALESSLSNIIG